MRESTFTATSGASGVRSLVIWSSLKTSLTRMNLKHLLKKKNIYLIKNLGTEKYYNLLNNSSLMMGNSSSGIIESASFKLPVLNLGDRQKGRYSGRNVLHSNFSISQVKKKFKIATSNKFKRKISKLKNPYRLKINSVNYCKKIISAFKSNKLS